MDDNAGKAKDYVYGQIKGKINSKEDPYAWLISQISYYKNPNYSSTEYTTAVLIELEEINSMVTIQGTTNTMDTLEAYCSLHEL